MPCKVGFWDDCKKAPLLGEGKFCQIGIPSAERQPLFDQSGPTVPAEKHVVFDHHIIEINGYLTGGQSDPQNLFIVISLLLPILIQNTMDHGA